MKEFHRIMGALIFIILLTSVGVMMDEGLCAQTPPQEPLWKGPTDSPRQKMGRSSPSRDPFSLPPGIHLRSKIKAVPVVSKTPETVPQAKIRVPEVPPSPLPPFLNVKAILIGDRTRLALIDRHVVGEGDSIQEEKVLVIAKDFVVLGKGEKRRTLFLRQSPVHVTVEEK
jgi:hypothetical protein